MTRKHYIAIVVLLVLAAVTLAIAQSIQSNGGPVSAINGTMVEGSDYAGTPLAHFLATDTSGHLLTAPSQVPTVQSPPYSCLITLSTNTTTQCQAAPAAGLRNYVQNYQLVTTAAGTATTVGLVYGTGANCGTGTTALTPVFPNTTITPANSAGTLVNLSGSGLVPPTVNAICGVQAGTTAGTTVVQVTGFVAP